jgi:hypothetical protein
MKYLDILFQEYLNATYGGKDGQIYIEGYGFYCSEILASDKEAYKQAFEDWKNNRIHELIEKAENMLQKFNINSRFDALKRQYKNKKLNLFLGAGISIPSGYKSWPDMLFYLQSHTDRISEEEMHKLIQEGKYEEAAQLLYDKLGATRFNELLENEYNLDKEEIKSSVNFLPLAFQESHIITTNFDNIIKNVYENNRLKFDEIILGFEEEEIVKLLNSENRLLIKLHGRANNPQKRILTQEEYDKFYSEHNLKKSLENIMHSSLLFIGCSLNTDRTIKSMMEITKENPSLARHYAFLQLNEQDNKEEIEKHLAKANIFPIWYDDDHDESIEAFLLLLTEGELYDN